MHVLKDSDIVTSEVRNETIYMTCTFYMNILKRTARAPPWTPMTGLQSCLYDTILVVRRMLMKSYFKRFLFCFQWEVLETAEEAVNPRVGRGISSATGHMGRILQG